MGAIHGDMTSTALQTRVSLLSQINSITFHHIRTKMKSKTKTWNTLFRIKSLLSREISNLCFLFGICFWNDVANIHILIVYNDCNKINHASHTTYRLYKIV